MATTVQLLQYELAVATGSGTVALAPYRSSGTYRYGNTGSNDVLGMGPEISTVFQSVVFRSPEHTVLLEAKPRKPTVRTIVSATLLAAS